MNKAIQEYNDRQTGKEIEICNLLAKVITNSLAAAEHKIWHGHPVWFINGNPIAGYSKLKDCIRLLFWSGQSFEEPDLLPEGKFKAAEKRYTNIDQVHIPELERWLKKATQIQWDYKNLIKRKGKLEKLT